jgi:hypothetical protein
MKKTIVNDEVRGPGFAALILEFDSTDASAPTSGEVFDLDIESFPSRSHLQKPGSPSLWHKSSNKCFLRFKQSLEDSSLKILLGPYVTGAFTENLHSFTLKSDKNTFEDIRLSTKHIKRPPQGYEDFDLPIDPASALVSENEPAKPKVVPKPVSEPPAPQPEPAPEQEPEPLPPVPPSPPIARQTPPKPANTVGPQKEQLPQKKSNTKIILAAIFGFTALLVLAATALYFVSRDKPEVSSKQSMHLKDAPTPDVKDGVAEITPLEDEPTVPDQTFDDLLIRVRVNDLYGYINAKGEWAITPRFAAANIFEANGGAWVNYNGLYGRVDKTGQWLVSPKFKDILYNSVENDDLVGVKSIDDLYGLINTAGEWVIQPNFKYLFNFSDNGLTKAQNDDDKWGFINATGEWAIQPKFKELHWKFTDGGLVQAKNEDDNWGFINATGKWVIQPKFKSP